MNFNLIMTITGLLSFWIAVFLAFFMVWIKNDIADAIKRKQLKNKGFGYVFIIGNNKFISKYFANLTNSSIRIKGMRVVDSSCIGSFDGFPTLIYHKDDVYPISFQRFMPNVSDEQLRDPKILDNLLMQTKTVANIFDIVKNNKYYLYAIIGLVVVLVAIYQQIKDGDVAMTGKIEQVKIVCQSAMAQKPMYV